MGSRHNKAQHPTPPNLQAAEPTVTKGASTTGSPPAGRKARGRQGTMAEPSTRVFSSRGKGTESF